MNWDFIFSIEINFLNEVKNKKYANIKTKFKEI